VVKSPPDTRDRRPGRFPSFPYPAAVRRSHRYNPQEPMLRVIAAAVLDPSGLLLVSKRAAPSVYYLPGGKPEPGEAPRQCLERELAEELGVTVAHAEPFAEVGAPAPLEN